MYRFWMCFSLLLFGLFMGNATRGVQGDIAAGDSAWKSIASGVEIRYFPIPKEYGRGTVVVARLEPRMLRFNVYSIKQLGSEKLTVVEWARRYQLVAVINAGMYLTDHRTHVGYLKHFDFVDNPRPVRQYFSAAAFNPGKKGLPPFRIFDLDEVPLDTVIQQYHTVIQNLRLIKRPGINRWSPKNQKAWSVTALGEDRQGRVLFIFCATPLPMFTFNRILLSLPLDLVTAQYLEGGPEASLYVCGNQDTVRLMGGMESGEWKNVAPEKFLPLPVVIGVKFR